MADQPADRQLLDEVLTGARAMASLAADEEVFRGAVDAFRAQDGESMHALLVRHKLVERCEVICHWLRSKEAVLLCLELAGPPRVEEEPPDVREFALAVAKITADEELVELLAEAVQERDGDAWRELISKHKLERFSHLLCHWVCTVHYRLVCDVVCQPIAVERPHLIPELQAAGQSIGRLAADEKLFASAAKAVLESNCELVGAQLEKAGFRPFCFVLCEWFCSWHCMLVCLRLCRVFPLERIESEIGEMLEFARAGGKLATKKGTLERLTAAVLREDVETVQKVVKELEFERFCIQFCHWVCFLRCQRFCICVCPPQSIAVFTKIGGLYYDTAVHSAAPGSGLTDADNRAFYNTLRLNGGLSVVDGAPRIEYRFETVATSPDGSTLPDGTPILESSWVPVAPAQIEATNIGSFVRLHTGSPPPPFFDVVEVWVKNSGPSIFEITPSADGWIQVPPAFPTAPEFPTPGTGWQFVPASDLIRFDTTSLAPSVIAVDETSVDAGDSAAAPLQTDVHYGIRMRIRNQGDVGDGSEAGTCSHIAINNTHYDNISHHPYWPGGLFGASHELAVASIGVTELAAAPCSLLTDSLTVEFTAAHSNLGGVSVSLQGPGGPYTFSLNPATAEDAGENWYGNATPLTHGSPAVPWTFADLAPCAYLLTLTVDVLLTTGDSVPQPLIDYIAFCKGESHGQGHGGHQVG
jgi:hypothetical protein